MPIDLLLTNSDIEWARSLGIDLGNPIPADAKCGTCRKWMASTCPQERNNGGRRSGPSMNGLACREYKQEAVHA